MDVARPLYGELDAIVRITARGRKLAKVSVNETMDIQGHRRAVETAAFKSCMITIPHRQAQGTYGAAARAKGVKARDPGFES